MWRLRNYYHILQQTWTSPTGILYKLSILISNYELQPLQPSRQSELIKNILSWFQRFNLYLVTILWRSKEMSMQLKKAIIRLKNENKDAKRAKKEMIFINGQVRHLISTQHIMLFSYWRQNRSKAERPLTSINWRYLPWMPGSSGKETAFGDVRGFHSSIKKYPQI